MNIGIFVHSQTGHSALLAKSIGDYLRQNKHEVNITLLKPTNFVKPRSKNVTLRKVPQTSEYNVIILVGPVWAFTSAPVIPEFLNQLDTLKNKIAIPIFTRALPSFFGGKQAVKTISKKLDILGASVKDGLSVSWIFRPSKNKISHLSEKILNRITE